MMLSMGSASGGTSDGGDEPRITSTAVLSNDLGISINQYKLILLLTLGISNNRTCFFCYRFELYS